MALSVDQPPGADELDEQELDRILIEVDARGSQMPAAAPTSASERSAGARPLPSVTISANRMTAFLTLQQPPSASTAADVRVQLTSSGVCHGMDSSELDLLLARGGPCHRQPIAHGTPAGEALDARIEYLFNAGTGRLEEHGGRVDWRNPQLTLDGVTRLLDDDRSGERFVAEGGQVIGLAVGS